MKLVELLVEFLEEWPEGVTYFVQDGDREVKAGLGSKLIEPDDSRIWVRHSSLNNYTFYSGLCTDWQTSVVTKDIYTKHKEETQMKQMRMKVAEVVRLLCYGNYEMSSLVERTVMESFYAD